MNEGGKADHYEWWHRPNKSLDASGITEFVIDNLSVTWLTAAASTQTLCNPWSTDMDHFEREKELSNLYSLTVKTYIQLSIGGLVLSITFIERVLGSKPEAQMGMLLKGTWILFLISAVLGATYQYLAVRWLEWIADTHNLLFKGVRRGKGGVLVDRCSASESRHSMWIMVSSSNRRLATA